MSAIAFEKQTIYVTFFPPFDSSNGIRFYVSLDKIILFCRFCTGLCHIFHHWVISLYQARHRRASLLSCLNIPSKTDSPSCHRLVKKSFVVQALVWIGFAILNHSKRQIPHRTSLRNFYNWIEQTRNQTIHNSAKFLFHGQKFKLSLKGNVPSHS